MGTEIHWINGVSLLNISLDTPVLLPAKLTVGIRQRKLLKSLLSNSYYAAIQVLEGRTLDLVELVVLKPFAASPGTRIPRSLYPSLETPA